MSTSGLYLVVITGFVLAVQTAATECGGTLTARQGTFTSPNYPLSYHHGTTCVWNIRVSTGFHIQLNINDFHLEAHSSCHWDAFEVYGGEDDTAPRLARLCGTQTTPRILTTTGNTMMVRFQTDGSVAHTGFSASYTAVSEVSECGGTLTARQGTFTSPNYPLSYHHGKTCVWTIRVPTGFHIQLNINDFHLEAHSSCGYDVFEVFGGVDFSAPRLARLCGTQTTPRTLTTTGNTMMVRFRTDGSVAHTGFSASYTAVSEVSECGGTLTARQGTFTSPNYPLSYHHGKTCVWTIRVPTGFHIQLNINDFHLEAHSSCGYDVFEVFGGVDFSAPRLARLCGTQTTPRTLTTTGNTMMVRFRTDGSVAHTGFSASYTAVSEECGGTLTARQGTFTSPNYPLSYHHGKTCVWTIRVPTGFHIKLNINDFHLEAHSSCGYDVFEVYGGEDDTAPQLARLCGTQTTTRTLTTTGNTMMVRFRTDGSVAHTGFSASYTAVSEGCGGTLTARDFIFASPNYPLPYPHETTCVWNIRVPTGFHIKLHIEDFHLQEASSCSCDVFEVYGGMDFSAPRLARLCGTQTTPYTLTTSGNTMVVRFRTDGSVAHKGFAAAYMAVSEADG